MSSYGSQEETRIEGEGPILARLRRETRLDAELASRSEQKDGLAVTVLLRQEVPRRSERGEARGRRLAVRYHDGVEKDRRRSLEGCIGLQSSLLSGSRDRAQANADELHRGAGRRELVSYLLHRARV